MAIGQTKIVYIKLAVGVGIAGLLVYSVHVAVGWRNVLDLFGRTDLFSLLVACTGIALSHVLRALRLIVCYRSLNVRLLDTAGIAFIHNSLNFWLPMRLGELALPLLSKSTLRVKYVDSTVTLVFIRLLDVHVLLVLVVYFIGGSLLNEYFLWMILACIAALPIVLLTQKFWLIKLPVLKDLQNITGTPRYWLSNYAITAAVWLSKLGALSFLALQLSAVDFNHVWVALILADASSISPITGLANAGTFEAGFVLPLWVLGYDAAATLAVAVAIHMVLGLVSLVIGVLGLVIVLTRTGNAPLSVITE